MASPASPCTGVCRLDSGGVCKGCGRLLSEIAEWPVASDARRGQIVASARERRRLRREVRRTERR